MNDQVVKPELDWDSVVCEGDGNAVGEAFAEFRGAAAVRGLDYGGGRGECCGDGGGVTETH